LNFDLKKSDIVTFPPYGFYSLQKNFFCAWMRRACDRAQQQDSPPPHRHAVVAMRKTLYDYAMTKRKE
jgi:hypothetical protein